MQHSVLLTQAKIADLVVSLAPISQADIYEGGLQTKERPKQDGRKVAAMFLQRRVFGFGYPSRPFS